MQHNLCADQRPRPFEILILPTIALRLCVHRLVPKALGLGMVPEKALGGGWIGFEVSSRAGWPTHKVAAAVGTHAFKEFVDTSGAKGALKRADTGIRIPIRKISITAFAVRLDFQHSFSNLRIQRRLLLRLPAFTSKPVANCAQRAP